MHRRAQFSPQGAHPDARLRCQRARAGLLRGRGRAARVRNRARPRHEDHLCAQARRRGLRSGDRSSRQGWPTGVRLRSAPRGGSMRGGGPWRIPLLQAVRPLARRHPPALHCTHTRTHRGNRYAGVLSAVGIHLADIVSEAQEPAAAALDAQALPGLEARLQVRASEWRGGGTRGAGGPVGCSADAPRRPSPHRIWRWLRLRRGTWAGVRAARCAWRTPGRPGGIVGGACTRRADPACVPGRRWNRRRWRGWLPRASLTSTCRLSIF